MIDKITNRFNTAVILLSGTVLAISVLPLHGQVPPETGYAAKHLHGGFTANPVALSARGHVLYTTSYESPSSVAIIDTPTTRQIVSLVGSGYGNVTAGIDSPLRLNQAGQATGQVSRQENFSTRGTDAWFYDGERTVLVGLIGDGYETGNGYRDSRPLRLSETGYVAGRSRRLSKTGTTADILGADVWLFDGSTTRLMGFTGLDYEWTVSGKVYRESEIVSLNDHGHLAGYSMALACGIIVREAWLFDGVETRRLGLPGATYERICDGVARRNTFILPLNKHGQIAGNSSRLGNGVGGSDAWLYNGSATLRVGFTGPGYEYMPSGSSALWRVSAVRMLNNAGQVTGESNRYTSNGNLLGIDPWLSDGVTIQRLGLLGAIYEKDDIHGHHRDSRVQFLNDAGCAAGISYIYYPPGGAGSASWDSWVFDGNTTRRVGLIGNDYEFDHGRPARQSTITHFNALGHAAGYSLRPYGTDYDDHGQDIWFSDGITTRIASLTGSAYEYTPTGHAGVYRYSEIVALNDADQMIGTTIFNPDGGLLAGESGWFYDAATDTTTALEFGRSSTRCHTTPTILTKEGVVLGTYQVYEDDVVVEYRTFWWSKESGFRDLTDMVTFPSPAPAQPIQLVYSGPTLRPAGSTNGNAPLYLLVPRFLLSAAAAPGDFDGDGDADVDDFDFFRSCALGPEIPQPDPACAKARLDGDDDIDSDDFGVFQRWYRPSEGEPMMPSE